MCIFGCTLYVSYLADASMRDIFCFCFPVATFEINQVGRQKGIFHKRQAFNILFLYKASMYVCQYREIAVDLIGWHGHTPRIDGLVPIG